MDIFSRTEMLIGRDGIKRLQVSEVVIFGLGGVGSYAAEALVRCGIGRFTLVDCDVVCETNINRQVLALQTTVGRDKTELMRERMRLINPAADVSAVKIFADSENIPGIIPPGTSYVVDAIDTVTSKLAIIECCAGVGVPVISSMGTGNKLYPERLTLADIYETRVCPLAKVMRKELKKRGINSLQVCYSDEQPTKPEGEQRRPPGSVSFVPPVAGMIIAGAVVRDILGVVG